MILRNIIFFILIILINFPVFSKTNRLIIASTTSTNDTGLLDFINKEFSEKYNIDIHVIALGTGQALEVAKRGNADILLVHHTLSEINFVKEGYGIKRYNLMYNDFIIVGPIDSNYHCDSTEDIFLKIKNDEMLFLSRGDDSGTHIKEMSLWNDIKFNPEYFSKWYKKVGQGMGSTLFIANEMLGYTLTDRSTWVKFKKKENLKIICENKPPLINQYGIIAINPNKYQNSNYKLAKTYINWITSEKGKKLINNFKISGQQLFTYNYQ